MTRVKRGTIAKKKHKKIIKQAKGYYGAKSRSFRSAKQAVIKSQQYSYRDRKCKKRLMRKNWIIILNAALKKYKIKYSQFINILKKNKIEINRKILNLLIKKNLFDEMLNKINLK